MKGVGFVFMSFGALIRIEGLPGLEEQGESPKGRTSASPLFPTTYFSLLVDGFEALNVSGK